MSNIEKIKEIRTALDGLEIQLERTIVIPIILDAPEDRLSINTLIDQIIALTEELRKYE
jgi:hypothetical protein